ncbi:MAG: LysM peptidoglycan-binding domain-containing protein [Kiritimatiellaeota bacterium]|nr:LysM peptidoglycan-binding domain-containing protein [Kiritimatiellota bacterium]
MNVSSVFVRGKSNTPLWFAVFAVSLLCVSCGPPNEKAHPAFRQGLNLFEKGKFKEAAASFEKYLLVNPKSAITHSKLAEIYNDNLNDPLMVVYHFRKYLEYEPDSSDAEAVDAWIAAAEKRYAREIRAKFPEDFPSDSELAELKERNAKYRECVLKLKEWNARLLREKRGGDAAKGSAEVADSGDVYVVRPGDTLSKISKRIYGTSKFHGRIFNANRDVLKTEGQLKIGQKLKIPKIDGVKSAVQLSERRSTRLP